MAVKWIFLWMGPGLSKVEVSHCLVRGRRTPENRPRCLLQRGQGNFKLAANFSYSSRGSADPRESLRKRRILKLALNAHKVFADLGVPCPSCVLADTRKEEPGLLKKWEKRW